MIIFHTLQELTSLNLSCAPLQEDSLPHLRFLQKLRELFLNSWNLEHCISDAGMAHLSLLLNLERLSMRSNWHISNAGLKPLLKLPWLAYLDLRGGLHIHAESALRQLKVRNHGLHGSGDVAPCRALLGWSSNHE